METASTDNGVIFENKEICCNPLNGIKLQPESEIMVTGSKDMEANMNDNNELKSEPESEKEFIENEHIESNMNDSNELKSDDVEGYYTEQGTKDTGHGIVGALVRRKKIEQLHIDTGEVLRRYDSGTLAASFMDISQSGISLCCASKKSESNGFRWRFYEGRISIILNELLCLYTHCIP